MIMPDRMIRLSYEEALNNHTPFDRIMTDSFAFVTMKAMHFSWDTIEGWII